MGKFRICGLAPRKGVTWHFSDHHKAFLSNVECSLFTSWNLCGKGKTDPLCLSSFKSSEFNDTRVSLNSENIEIERHKLCHPLLFAVECLYTNPKKKDILCHYTRETAELTWATWDALRQNYGTCRSSESGTISLEFNTCVGRIS